MRHGKSNETGRHGLTLAVVIALSAAVSACGDWPYPLENPWDSYRCEQGCQDGETCYEGECVPYKAPGTWVTIKAGSFKMGSLSTENCREPHSAKETQHDVKLTSSFEMQTTEVTQAQFKTMMGYSPSNFTSCGTTCPVEQVNWYEAAAYANALSAKAGLTQCYTCSGSGSSVTCQETSAAKGKGIYSCKGYRLPTEAEWEYAYRAGNTSAFYNGAITSCTGKDSNLEKIGWYDQNSSSTTHPAGKKTPNAWGLYDMAGNVYEWCHDWYVQDLGSTSVTDPVGTSGSYRVFRGGSCDRYASYARAADRDDWLPATRSSDLGFRLARSVP